MIKPALAAGETEGDSALRPGSGLQGRRVLVVDDNLDSAQSFAALLELMGSEVRTAGNGPEALDIAKEYRPDVVLLDIGLPGMSGYEVARSLRAFLADRVTIVAVSGFGADEDRERSAEAGFDAHFLKPMEIGTLEQFLGSRKG